MMKRWTLGLLVAALALTVAGCSAAEDKIVEENGEEIAGEVVGGDDEVGDGSATATATASGDDSNVMIPDDSGEVPEEFPSDFPLYKDADLESASSAKGGDGTSFYLSLTSDDDVQALYDWFKAEFKAEGWEIVSDMNTSTDDGMTAIISVKKGTVDGSVTMASIDGGSELGIILTEK